MKVDHQFREEELLKGSYIVVLHATRTPPHIGLIIDKQYHSLTIKGQEINVPVAALIRTTMQRKLPSLFIKIKQHPTFSTDYLREHFISNIQLFPKVASNVATCLSPIKSFFEETYHVPTKNINYIFELLPELKENGLTEDCSALFIDGNEFELPLYNMKELNSSIDRAGEEVSFTTKTLRTLRSTEA